MPKTPKELEMRAELARELEGLQSSWQQIAQKLTLKVRSRFREIGGRLQRSPEQAPLAAAELRGALGLVRELKIKPDKARAKDLLRIERLLKELSAVLPESEA
jgi:hypothetical protein